MSGYRTLNESLRERFGEKVYKLALDGGFTCPNRDGTLSDRGCTFCAGGSGDFSVPVGTDVFAAIEQAKTVVAGKTGAKKFVAYFQRYTNTYAPVSRLRELFSAAISHPDVVALAIATRPDCLEQEKIGLLRELNRIKPLWVELGLQTIHPETAERIRRCYPLEAYDDAVRRLKAAGIETVVHMIIGLPGETEAQMVETARYIADSGADGIKFQLLHVLKGTDLAADYAAGAFRTLERGEYLRILAACLEVLPPEMIVHRVTGDGSRKDLIAPLWSTDKKGVLNEIRQLLRAR